MVNTVTLDSIVRKSLAINNLPMHYYIPFYLHGKRIVEDLYFDVLPSKKTTLLSIDSANQADLPSDYIKDIFVAVEIGDKIKTIPRNPSINPLASDAAFDVSYSLPYNSETVNLFYEDAYYAGINWARGFQFYEGYRIIEESNKIRIDNRLGLMIDQIVFCYLADADQVNSQTVVHKFSQQTILDFIDWQWSKHGGNRFDARDNKRDYNNSYRLLRARMSNLSKSDILRSIRSSKN